MDKSKFDWTYQAAIERLFEVMTENYDAETFPQLEAVYQFIFNADKKILSLYIVLSGGKVKVVKGRHKKPSITVKTSAITWLDFLAERLDSKKLPSSSINISGDRKLLFLMPRIFKEKKPPSFEKLIEEYEIEETRNWKKPAKVLVFNGSPQRENGTTDVYLDLLIDGIKETGLSVEKIYLTKHKISSCKGCLNCWWKTPGECIIKDDAPGLYKKWLDCDLSIFAYPLYGDAMPVIVKKFFDRANPALYPYQISYKNTTRHPIRYKKERYVAHLLTCGFPEVKQFDPILQTIEAYTRQIHMPNLANILRPAAWDPVINPLSRKFLIEIAGALKVAGRQLVEKGSIDNELLEAISRQYMSAQAYRDFINKFALQKLTSKRDESRV